MARLVNIESFVPATEQPSVVQQISYSELAERGKFLSHHEVGELWFYQNKYFTCKVDNGQERVYLISEEMARELQSRVFAW